MRRPPHSVRESLGAALAALLGLTCAACESSALSRGDPNELNAQLDPPYVSRDGTQATWILTLLDEEADEAPADAADMADNYIITADFGQGVGLNNTGYTFKSNFVIELGLTVYAEAEEGTRTFSVRFVNHYGEFLAHGEFTVYTAH